MYPFFCSRNIFQPVRLDIRARESLQYRESYEAVRKRLMGRVTFFTLHHTEAGRRLSKVEVSRATNEVNHIPFDC